MTFRGHKVYESIRLDERKPIAAKSALTNYRPGKRNYFSNILAKLYHTQERNGAGVTSPPPPPRWVLGWWKMEVRWKLILTTILRKGTSLAVRCFFQIRSSYHNRSFRNNGDYRKWCSVSRKMGKFDLWWPLVTSILISPKNYFSIFSRTPTSDCRLRLFVWCVVSGISRGRFSTPTPTARVRLRPPSAFSTRVNAIGTCDWRRIHTWYPLPLIHLWRRLSWNVPNVRQCLHFCVENNSNKRNSTFSH